MNNLIRHFSFFVQLDEINPLCFLIRSFPSYNHILFICHLMSDTSILSTRSSSSFDDDDRSSSCSTRTWLTILNFVLLLITIITSALLVYYIHQHDVRDRERQRNKDEFKRKHRITSRLLDLIMKDGFIYKWIKTHKGPIANTFKDLFQDIVQTLFNE